MRRTILAAAAVVMLILSAACGSGSDDQTTAGGMRKVSVGVIPIVDVAPIYLGRDKGFFEDEGLKLDLQTLHGGEATVPAVVSGQVEFGFSNVVSLLLAADKGLPVKLVAAGNASTGKQGKDFGGLIVPGDSRLKSAKDLEGKTVSVNAVKNIAEVTIRAAVDKAGGNPDKVHYVEIGFPDVPAAIAKHQADAAWVVEPFLTIATSQGARVLTSNLVDTAPDLMLSSYFTSNQMIDEDADLVDSFTAAMKKSLEYAGSHPDEAREIVPDYTEITPKVAEKITLPNWPSEIDRDSVEVLNELSLGDGLIDDEVDLDELIR